MYNIVFHVYGVLHSCLADMTICRCNLSCQHIPLIFINILLCKYNSCIKRMLKESLKHTTYLYMNSAHRCLLQLKSAQSHYPFSLPESKMMERKKSSSMQQKNSIKFFKREIKKNG